MRGKYARKMCAKYFPGIQKIDKKKKNTIECNFLTQLMNSFFSFYITITKVKKRNIKNIKMLAHLPARKISPHPSHRDAN